MWVNRSQHISHKLIVCLYLYPCYISDIEIDLDNGVGRNFFTKHKVFHATNWVLSNWKDIFVQRVLPKMAYK